MDHFLGNFSEHLIVFVAGGTALGIVAHAVNTFPTPRNPYGAWLLGVVQFAVGQRVAAMNTLKGQDTVTTGVNKSIIP